MILTRHQFTRQEQLSFCRLSRDYNPVHRDDEYARRTLFGEPVVHGVHIVLRMLFECNARVKKLDTIIRLKARFPKPITLRDPVDIVVKRHLHNEIVLEALVSGAVYASCSVSFRVEESFDEACSRSPFFRALSMSEACTTPDCPEWYELATSSGSVELAFSEDEWIGLFDRDTVQNASFMNWAAALLSSTFIVGMKCPGLHSIFTSIDLYASPSGSLGENALRTEYTVSEADERFSRITVATVNSICRGELVTFYRPPPKEQPGFATLRNLVCADDYQGVSALIIGGSRGLGEVTTKLLLAGGASVHATFHRGRHEMERIAQDVAACSDHFSYSSLDVLAPEEGLTQLPGVCERITHLFYFPTPPIFAAKPLFFTAEVFEQFMKFYVYSFEKIVSLLSPGDSKRHLAIYWPSSIALDEATPGLAEYCMAKAAGEVLCRQMEKSKKILRLFTPRLPRAATDQTQTIHSVSAIPAHELMLEQLKSFIPGK